VFNLGLHQCCRYRVRNRALRLCSKLVKSNSSQIIRVPVFLKKNFKRRSSLLLHLKMFICFVF
jgi:hypothetical protein